MAALTFWESEPLLLIFLLWPSILYSGANPLVIFGAFKQADANKR